MSVKTITVKEAAYNALKSKQEANESFSDTILRITKRRPLSDFFGVLSKGTGERMEKAIMESRKKYTKEYAERVKTIAKSLQER